MEMFEDELPDDLTDLEYNLWFKKSYIPDGVGCRVGPKVKRKTTFTPPRYDDIFFDGVAWLDML